MPKSSAPKLRLATPWTLRFSNIGSKEPPCMGRIRDSDSVAGCFAPANSTTVGIISMTCTISSERDIETKGARLRRISGGSVSLLDRACWNTLRFNNEVSHSQSFLCQSINTWGRYRATLDTNISPPPIIDKNIEDVGLTLCICCAHHQEQAKGKHEFLNNFHGGKCSILDLE